MKYKVDLIFFVNLEKICNVMKTIVIDIEEGTNARRILEAVRLLKGVKSATIAGEEELENISMLKACRAARRTDKVSKEEVLNALR
jgi:hypothetical protein